VPPEARRPAHTEPLVHACPTLSLHAPVESQILVPVHVFGSLAFVTVMQAPVASHVVHTPLHAPPQQFSLHTPAVQSRAWLQDVPVGIRVKISAVESATPDAPPATSTLPEGSNVAVW
jgi:hypothetical protein